MTNDGKSTLRLVWIIHRTLRMQQKTNLDDEGTAVNEKKKKKTKRKLRMNFSIKKKEVGSVN